MLITSGRVLSQRFYDIADEIAGAIRAACSTRNVSTIAEEYAIFTIQSTGPRVDADTITDQLDLARLLFGENGPISQRERVQQSHHSISYSPDELVVLRSLARLYDELGKP